MKLLITVMTAVALFAGTNVPKTLSPMLDKLRYTNAVVEVDDADFHHEDDEIAFVFTYSNYAWIRTYTVTFVTCGGEKYYLDLSDEENIKTEELLPRLRKEIDKKKFASDHDKNLIRTCVLEAEKIDKNAEFTREHAACDAGSRDVYSAVDGELLLLCESGDFCGKLHDEHAELIVGILEEAGLATVWK